MFNFYESKLQESERFRLLKCGDSLITLYNCPLENKFVDLWSQHNYIVYVIEGRKIWHTAHGSYDLRKGACVFVRKGASIVEQFFDTSFCLVLFFVPDEFIFETLKTKSTPISKPGKKYEQVIAIAKNENLESFFNSMISYFDGAFEPDKSLLELKFRELILIMADNSHNTELLSYFGSLLREPMAISLQRVMEDNYCFNLKLKEYAELSNRSLSAFKRDFQKFFGNTPGKWLLEKRLTYAMHLLSNMNKTVAETAFESGFENTSHFSRSFKERFGMSPAAIKQKQGN
ncbi:MAG: helix-turn-helix transcriptional regulator [Bacteroidetes bacterium]|nr:helix-turn-helix transcriptional regulator [Bacteroidota bacterium]MBS1929880.1 helix-turn-helix transcriptional regulator [Bacteroidota bacterium]